MILAKDLTSFRDKGEISPTIIVAETIINQGGINEKNVICFSFNNY